MKHKKKKKRGSPTEEENSFFRRQDRLDHDSISIVGRNIGFVLESLDVEDFPTTDGFREFRVLFESVRPLYLRLAEEYVALWRKYCEEKKR